jgi:hypothetical protein
MDMETLKEIIGDLKSLDHQIEGALYVLSEENQANAFLQYLQRCLSGFQAKLRLMASTVKNNPPNCS